MKIYQKSLSKGFALIATISVLSLLVMIAIGMLTLSTVTTRSAEHTVPMLQAKANARMALMMALGELQKAAGPDQRVTATAETAESAIGSTSLPQKRLLGVWQSFTQSNLSDQSPDYDGRKTSDFITWLCSSSEDRTDLSFAKQDVVSPSVQLVDNGSITDVDAVVSAELISVTSDTGVEGQYGWQVFDESQKVNMTLFEEEPTTDVDKVTTLGVAGTPGFKVDAKYDALEDLKEDRDRLMSLKSSQLVSFDPVEDDSFHKLTTNSKSLLVDVANGGFQKDLSLLFENTTLPTEYASRHIYSETDTPSEPAVVRFDGAEPIPSPDPKWSLLQSHYKMYENVDKTGDAYSIAASNVKRELGTSYFDEQQLHPVIANAQFIFSMSPQQHSLDAPYTGFLALWVDVVVTLWNPYNVELDINAMELEFYRFPLQVQFFRTDENGTLSASDGPVHIAYMFNRGNNATGVENIQDRLPYRARVPAVGTIKPGEYKVFGSPTGITFNHQNRNYSQGLELEQGFNPYGGGVFERYISTGPDYRGQCDWPVNNRTQIQLKPDDVFSVEVSSAKVDRGSALWPETNNEEIAAYLKTYMGDGGVHSGDLTDPEGWEETMNETRNQMGAIELNVADLSSSLPSYGQTEMSTLTVSAGNTLPRSSAPATKVPFLIASLRLKTESDSDVLSRDETDTAPEVNMNSSMWLHNGVTNPYFTNGLPEDKNDPEPTHQYELTWEPMQSWNNIPTVEVDDKNRGYGGPGITSASGVNSAAFAQVPLIPATSIAQFSHAPLNSGGQSPLTTQIVGNSFASPLIPRENKLIAGNIGNLIDHSYMANTTLFDSYFLSTATSESGPLFTSSARNLDTVLSEFFDGTKALRNPNFEPAVNSIPVLTADDYADFGQYIYNKGAFNVNSTSVEAWALFLASGTNDALPILDILTSTLGDAVSSDEAAFSRFAPMIGDEVSGEINDQSRWMGHRRLSAAQITTLAEEVVKQVKERGPFQSVAEFVNRRLKADSTGNSGALQSAIEASALNTDFGFASPKNNDELEGGSYTGNTSDGAATQIIQSDILNRLAPSITVRGDTFVIRAYGEATVGSRTSKAWCEAVVQRGHAFVDNTQDPTTAVSNLNQTNLDYGRRFEVVSFRWLNESEI